MSSSLFLLMKKRKAGRKGQRRKIKKVESITLDGLELYKDKSGTFQRKDPPHQFEDGTFYYNRLNWKPGRRKIE